MPFHTTAQRFLGNFLGQTELGRTYRQAQTLSSPKELRTAFETFKRPIETFGRQIGGGVNIQLARRRTEDANKRLQEQINRMVVQQSRVPPEQRERLRRSVTATQEQINRNIEDYRRVVGEEIRPPREVIEAGVGTAATTLGLLSGARHPAALAKFTGVSGVLGGLVGGGIAALQGKKPSEIIEQAKQSAAEFLGRAPAIYGVVRGTDPFLARALQKVSLPAQRFLSQRGLGAISQTAVRRGLPAALNVLQGVPVDIALQRKPLTPESLAIDIATGALFGPGQFQQAEFKLPSKESLRKIGGLFGQQKGFIKLPFLGQKVEKMPDIRLPNILAEAQAERLLSEGHTPKFVKGVYGKDVLNAAMNSLQMKRLIKWRPQEGILRPEEMRLGDQRGFIDFGAKVELPTKTFGAIQKEIQRKTGRGFLADFDKAVNRGNFEVARKIIANVPESNPYKKVMKNLLDRITPEFQVPLQQKPLTEFQRTRESLRTPYEGIFEQTRPPALREIMAQKRLAEAGFIKLGEEVGIPPIKPEVPKIETPTLQKIQTGFEAGKKAREVKRITPDIRTQLLDRLSPIFDLVKQAKEDLPVEVNPYKRMRLLAGLNGKIEIELKQGLQPVLQRNRTRLPDLSSLLIMDRTKELIANGKKTFLSTDDLARGRTELIAKYGQDGFDQLEQSAKEVRQFGNTLLKRLRNSGIIDDVSYKNIKAKNQFYVPFEVVEHITDNLEKGRFARTSYNVASQDVIKRLIGSEKELGDPIEALVRKTGQVMALTERNEAMQNLINLRNVDSAFQELITPFKETDVIPKGMNTINLFVDGQNVRYLVPEPVAAAIKNLDAEASNILVRTLTPQARILRAGATILNMAFIPTNIIRDIQNAMFLTRAEQGLKGTAELIFSYPMALASAAKRDDLYQDWLRQGGAHATLTEQLFRRPQITVQSLAGIKPPLYRRVATAIPDAIRYLGETGEQATRLARYKAGLTLGETPTEAAIKSRDVTVDFSKAGTIGKILNQVIPFLNANIQGAERLGHAWKQNPKQAALMAGTFIGFPAMLLYILNRSFDDYNDIPQYERDLNWIIIYKDRTPQERAERKPLYAIKAPKGQIISPVANAIENFLRFVDNNHPRSVPEFFATFIEDISPIGFPYNREAMGKSLSRILPPGLRAGIEATTGQSLFRGQPIVPEYMQDVAPAEQYTQYTPELYKQIGQLFNVSPLQLENIVQTTTGGVGRQVGRVLSGDIFGGTGGEIGRRFTEVRGGEQVGKEFEEIRKFEEEKRTLSLKDRRLAQQIIDEIVASTTKEGRLQVLRKYQNVITPSIEKAMDDLAEEKALKTTQIERALRNSSVSTRARVILNQIKSLETKQERATYVQRMQQIGMLTQAVEEEIARIMGE